MGLASTLVVGVLAAVFGVGGATFAAKTVGEFREAGRVVAGPADDLTRGGAEEHETFLEVTLADGPDAGPVTLGQVHDTFGYWLVRQWATGNRRNGFTHLYRLVLAAIYRPGDYREDDDRRRGWTVTPDSVLVRVDGELLDVTFDGGVRPLQRLEADGATVPALAGIVITLAGFLVVLSPVLAVVFLGVRTAGAAAALGFVALVGGLGAGKAYHDTGLVGHWSTVTDIDDEAVPAAVADDTVDPSRTAKCDLVRVAPGDRLGVVGTVESTADGLRVTEGVVSTRGRWFLAVAATIDAVRTFVFAVLCLLVAAGGAYLLAPALVAGAVGAL